MIILLPFLVSLPKKEAIEAYLTESNLLILINQDRIKNGVRPLRPNLKLGSAATAKAQDMLKNNYFAHTSPLGTKPWDFIKETGLKYAFAGENLALNYTNPYELENDFLKSPPHRENLLSPLFSETGIAVLQGFYQGKPAVLTVQLFASPLEEKTVASVNY